MNFISLFIPSKAAELKAFIEHCTSKLELATKEEFISILTHYYEALVSDNKPDDDFEADYFKDVWLVQEGNRLIFRKRP